MSALVILLAGGCVVAIVAILLREVGRHPLGERRRAAHVGSDGATTHGYGYGDAGNGSDADCGGADAGGGCDGGGGGGGD